MGKKNKPDSPFPEMGDILSGMEDLMRDENGNPLTPDHPQYQKLAALMESMVNSINTEGEKTPFDGPQGQA
ncbi:MAG: hypothetical protein MRJ96_13240 [Nitrospirales bacterium]|nr:hypothetical protein [Nitrospira sp.]MDR4502408.1 hypothetical protein [Nitrospirales bacterium]